VDHDQTRKGLVTVFGGSGFIGRHVVRVLVRNGWRVRVACRRPDRALDLRSFGEPRQIDVVQANLRHPQSIAAALEGAQLFPWTGAGLCMRLVETFPIEPCVGGAIIDLPLLGFVRSRLPRCCLLARRSPQFRQRLGWSYGAFIR
jgi:NAD(P)-dependent dehydrogenase (short-subunit alcohol dehydrogenase family)